jgi:hypothetical protein
MYSSASAPLFLSLKRVLHHRQLGLQVLNLPVLLLIHLAEMHAFALGSLARRRMFEFGHADFKLLELGSSFSSGILSLAAE